MNIVFIGQCDNSGVLSMYADVINQHTKHKANAIVGFDQYGHHSDIVIRGIKWGRNSDIKPKERIRLAIDILSKADVLVINNGSKNISGDLRWEDFCNSKKVVCFFGDVQNKNICVGNCNITNQPQIFFKHKNMEFIPTAISNIEKIKEGTDIKNTSHVLITHSTIDRDNKNTESFLRVMSYLMKNYDINYEIIEKSSYWETILKKSLSQIGVDHIHESNRYYGISSLENSVLGLINITHLETSDVKLIMDFFKMDDFLWKTIQSEGELYSCIVSYVSDKVKLLKDREASQKWFLEKWDNKKIAKKLIDVLN